MSKITLHDLENRRIEILSSYIKKILPIKNHAYFPVLKTQIILNPGCLFCSGSDNWIYVKETSEQIKNLIAESSKMLGKN